MKAVESCNHIILWCPAVYDLWCMIYELLGINWVMTGTVKEEIWAWGRLSMKKEIVKLIPLTIF